MYLCSLIHTLTLTLTHDRTCLSVDPSCATFVNGSALSNRKSVQAVENIVTTSVDNTFVVNRAIHVGRKFWARDAVCACGKSCRSLGTFVERQRLPLTPTTTTNVVSDTPPNQRQTSSLPTKRMRPADCDTSCNARRNLFDRENVIVMEVHPHENSKDYVMRVHERGGNASRERWEDCRILSKFKVKQGNNRFKVLCTIECRQRQDLNETTPWRPEDPVRWVNE